MMQTTTQMVTPVTTKERKADEKVRRAQRKMEQCIVDIKSRLREMVFVLSVFEPVAIHEKLPILTNGKELYYSPEYVLATGADKLEKEILHITLHGLLGHFEEEEHLMDRELAWAVMDQKVDRLMRFLYTGVGEQQGETGNGKEPMGLELYYRAKKNKGLREKVLRHGKAVVSDDHNAWRMQSISLELHMTLGGNNGQQDSGEGQSKSAKEKQEAEWKAAREVMKDLLQEKLGLKGDLMEGGTGKGLEQMLDQVMDQMQRAIGTQAGQGELAVVDPAGDPADYRSVLGDLRKLGTVCGEEDVPDPIYYCYGLELYEDVPLVEPLEEAERAAIETLVVAVDTSGSCVRELPNFLRETRGLLDQLTETMNVKRVWYLECDTEIQDEVLYEGDGIRYAFTEEHTYDGGGGTDFRPVFERIAEYERQGGTVAGLLYYSDGQGPFPVEEPDYPCYFILPRNDFDDFYCGVCDDDLPEWVLQKRL